MYAAPTLPNNLPPPAPPSHTKNGSAFAAVALFGGQRWVGGGAAATAMSGHLRQHIFEAAVVAHLWGGGGGASLGRWRQRVYLSIVICASVVSVKASPNTVASQA